MTCSAPPPRPNLTHQNKIYQCKKKTNVCKPLTPTARRHPCPYLEHEDSHVRHGQVNLGALPVGSPVKPDAIHFQLPGNLKHLEIRLSWRLAPGIRQQDLSTETSLGLRTHTSQKPPGQQSKLMGTGGWCHGHLHLGQLLPGSAFSAHPCIPALLPPGALTSVQKICQGPVWRTQHLSTPELTAGPPLPPTNRKAMPATGALASSVLGPHVLSSLF